METEEAGFLPDGPDDKIGHSFSWREGCAGLPRRTLFCTILNMSFHYLLKITALTPLLLVSASLASEPLLVEEFDGPDGEAPLGWEIVEQAGNGYVWQQGDRLHMRRSGDNAYRVMAIFSDDVDGEAAYNLEDYSVSMVFNQGSGSNDPIGVMVRIQEPSIDPPGYAALVRVSSGTFQLVRDPEGYGSDEVLAELEDESLPLRNNQFYRIQLTANGTRLVAEVFEMDMTGNFSISIGRLEAEDSWHAMGAAGIRYVPGAPDRFVDIEEFSILDVD